jgi:hypothetical protein
MLRSNIRCGGMSQSKQPPAISVRFSQLFERTGQEKFRTMSVTLVPPSGAGEAGCGNVEAPTVGWIGIGADGWRAANSCGDIADWGISRYSVAKVPTGW